MKNSFLVLEKQKTSKFVYITVKRTIYKYIIYSLIVLGNFWGLVKIPYPKTKTHTYAFCTKESREDNT